MTLKLELDMFIRWQGDPSREAIGGYLEFGADVRNGNRGIRCRAHQLCPCAIVWCLRELNDEKP
jgi:hypothetical protein